MAIGGSVNLEFGVVGVLNQNGPYLSIRLFLAGLMMKVARILHLALAVLAASTVLLALLNGYQLGRIRTPSPIS